MARSSQIHELWAKELVVGFGRLDGQVVGVVANNPMIKGGVLFVDSADKAARFIQLCDAFNVPLLFLADVPGFMVGTAVEREGIIRHGAKLITAVCEATVPKISVDRPQGLRRRSLRDVRARRSGRTRRIALPTAKIAVMGAEAAINAVHYNRIQEIEDEAEREAYVTKLREEYEEDIDIVHLASELVVDAIVEPEQLRARADPPFRGVPRQEPFVLDPPSRSHAGLGTTARPGRFVRVLGCGPARLEEDPAAERPEPPDRP